MAKKSRKKRSRKKREQPRRTSRVANEVLGILFVLLFGFSLLCLITYHPDDPSSFRFPGSAEAKNFMGPAGAWVSSWLFELIGYAAFLIPFICAFVAMTLFRWIGGSVGIVRSIMFVLCLASFSGFLEVLGWRPFFELTHPGGVIGLQVAGWMKPLFGSIGTGLIAASLAALFAVAASGIAFSQALAKLGELAWTATSAVASALWNAVRFVHSAARQSRGAKPTKRTRPKPHIKPKTAKPLPTSPEPQFRSAEAELDAEPIKVKVLDRLPDVEPAPEEYSFPPIDLLQPPPPEAEGVPQQKELEETAHQIEEKMAHLGIEGKVEKIWPGPVLTTYEYEPSPNIPIDKVLRVVKDIQLSLGRHGVRIIVPLPGSPRKVGIEVPNRIRETVYLRSIIDSKAFKNSASPLTIAMGKDIFGSPYIADLAKMPHILVAGTTGSGKSVFLNCAILSFIYKAHPATLRMILIDPKMLEFSHYEGIPHLMHPVVTDAVEAVQVLKWVVDEMDRRYRVLAEAGARDIRSYMAELDGDRRTGEDAGADGNEAEDAPEREPLPFLVIVVDEFADLMATAPREIEQAVIRLSQKARAAGIHLILATQRPSVDVITGLIKANFPARISFKLRTKIDSRTILDVGGAEELLGFGDMFFLPSTSGNLIRLHAALVTPPEIERVVEFVRRFAPERKERIEKLPKLEEAPKRRAAAGVSAATDEEDELYSQILEFAMERGFISTTIIQNRFRIGYVKAARMIQRMEAENLIGPPESGGKPRKVLVASEGHDDGTESV